MTHDLRLGIGIGKECEQARREALSRRAQRHQHLNDVVAREVPRLPHEGLRSVIEEPRIEGGVRREAELLAAREGPAGEGARRLANIVLRVVPDAGGEEFHQLPRVVLVGLAFAVGLRVEVDHHRRVFRDRLQELVEVGQRHLPKELVLRVQLGGTGLVQSAGQQAVPEERHLFLERPRGLHHALQPPCLHRARSRTLFGGEVKRRKLGLERGIGRLLVVQHRLGHRRAGHRGVAVELGAGRTETGAPE